MTSKYGDGLVMVDFPEMSSSGGKRRTKRRTYKNKSHRHHRYGSRTRGRRNRHRSSNRNQNKVSRKRT